MRLACFWICRPHIIEWSEGTVSEKKNNMPRFIPPEIKERHPVLLDIRAKNSKTNIPEFLRTIQSIQKESDESNGYYEGV